MLAGALKLVDTTYRVTVAKGPALDDACDSKLR